MTETMKDIVMYDVKKTVLLDLLKKKQRTDHRALDEYRTVKVEKGVIDTAEGSALAHIGKTQVLVGAKIDIAAPFPDKPEDGVFSVNCEFLPFASPTFESGPPGPDSIELARVTDRGIRSAEIEGANPITADFFLEEGKVLALYLDICVLDHAGNLNDAASLAALGALSDTKIPKYEDGKLIRGECERKLKLNHFPIATTFAKIDNYLLADPNKEEAFVADTELTITTTQNNQIAAMQKGKGALQKDELFEAVDIAFKKGAELRKYIL